MSEFEQISSLYAALDTSELISELPILAGATFNLVEMAKEINLKESQVMTYMAFMHYIHTIPDREHSKKIVSHFIKIPKKKMLNYDTEDTKNWLDIQIAKTFYTPISKMLNKEYISKYDTSLPMYYAMAHYFLSYFSRLSNDELIEKYNGLISMKNFTEMARMSISLFMIAKDNQVIEISLTNMKSANLYRTFSYYLNEVIKQSYLYLLKYGKKESIVSLADTHFELANQIISEDINRALQEKQEYESITKEYEKTISQIDKDIEDFKLKSNALTIENNNLERLPLLKGLSVLVVGNEKEKDDYHDTLQKYGAESIDILNGLNEPSRVRELAINNDISYVFGAYANELVIKQLKGLENIIPVPKVHLSSLEYEIKHTYDFLQEKLAKEGEISNA